MSTPSYTRVDDTIQIYYLERVSDGDTHEDV